MSDIDSEIKVRNKLRQLNEIINDQDSAAEDEGNNEKSAVRNDENELKLCPDFSNYLYFLFAPTLVYRDNYPR
jgi:hypothetical protein